MSVKVSGEGALAQVLRDGVHSDTRSAVIVVDLNGENSISSLTELTDEHIDEIFEQPMRRWQQHFSKLSKSRRGTSN